MTKQKHNITDEQLARLRAARVRGEPLKPLIQEMGISEWRSAYRLSARMPKRGANGKHKPANGNGHSKMKFRSVAVEEACQTLVDAITAEVKADMLARFERRLRDDD